MNYINRMFVCSIFINFLFGFNHLSCLAQIQPNSNTIYKNNTVSGGSKRGGNLFHTYKKLNIKNTEVKFIAPKNIKNIINIVEGRALSEISNKITIQSLSLDKVNFILINPHGISLMPNAIFNFEGSFLGSTASSVDIVGNNKLSFNFKNDPGEINISGFSFGNPLTVPAGETLMLIGRKIHADNNVVLARGGNIEFGSFNKNSTVQVSSLRNGWRLTNYDANKLNDIKIVQGGLFVPNSDLSGGFIRLVGKNIIINNATLDAAKGFGPLVNTGSVTLYASGKIVLKNNSRITTSTFSSSNSSPIMIKAKSILFQEGQVTADSSASGDLSGESGMISISADEEIILSKKGTRVSSETVGGAKGGNIELRAEDIEIREQALITSAARESGDAGNVLVHALNSILVDGENSGISAITTATQSGNGGRISLQADRINVLNGGTITVSSQFPSSTTSSNNMIGDAGEISLIANDVLISGTNSQVQGISEGDQLGGDISIQSKKLLISDSGQLTVNALPLGTAGNIILDVKNLVLNKNGEVSALTANGQGNIDVKNAQSILLLQGGNIITDAKGLANGGNINLQGDFLFGNGDSNILARAEAGNGGTISVDVSKGLIGFIENNQNDLLSNDIVVSSEEGVSGVIDFLSPITDPIEKLIPIETSAIDQNSLNFEKCSSVSNRHRNKSSFNIKNSSVTLELIDQNLKNYHIKNNWIDNVQENFTQISSSNIDSSFFKQTLIEAKGWSIASNGDIALVPDSNSTLKLPSKNNIC